MGKRNDSTTRLKQLQKAKEGIAKHFQNVSSLTLGGVTVAPADLTALIQADLDGMDALEKLRAALKVQVKATRDAHDKVLPLLRLLRGYVYGLYGVTETAATTLEDFGYQPHKASTKTLAAKVGGQAKTEATRKARHTMGSKQKKAVTGQPSTPSTPKA